MANTVEITPPNIEGVSPGPKSSSSNSDIYGAILAGVFIAGAVIAMRGLGLSHHDWIAGGIGIGDMVISAIGLGILLKKSNPKAGDSTHSDQAEVLDDDFRTLVQMADAILANQNRKDIPVARQAGSAF